MQSTRTRHYAYSHSTSKTPLTESPKLSIQHSPQLWPQPIPHHSYQKYVRWRYFSSADQWSLPWSNSHSLRRTQGLSYEYGSIYPLLTATTPNVGPTPPWVQIGRSARPVSVVAYADYVTVCATTVADFSIIEESIRLYEKASSARLNPLKSKAIAI